MREVKGKMYAGNGKFEDIKISLDWDCSDSEWTQGEEFNRLGYSDSHNIKFGQAFGWEFEIHGPNNGNADEGRRYAANFTDVNFNEYIFFKDIVSVLDFIRWVQPAIEVLHKSDYEYPQIVQILFDPDANEGRNILGLAANGSVHRLIYRPKNPKFPNSRSGMEWTEISTI